MALRALHLALLAACWLANAEALRAENACADAPALPHVVAATAPAAGEAPGEIVLALPKGPGGSLRTAGLALAPGARIVSSRWSPILCATLAVVVGPAELALEDWVPGLPRGAVVVENTPYHTADVTTAGDAPRTTPGATSERELAAPGASAEPDPYRRLQYGLDRIGVDAARAVTEGRGVTVAVLDSAPDLSHPELARARRVEGGSLPAVPVSTHGTLVAGVIGALRGNGIGIEGVAPATELLAVPVCRPAASPDEADLCLLYDMLAGLDAAFAAGAQVMNLSLVGPPNPLLERATLRLDELGVLVAAAAGNDGDLAPRYPAAYPAVIGVGAVDVDGAAWPRSNLGPSAEILAPGVEIVSTTPGGHFAFADGTSLATAHVSGVLALLLGVDPDPAHARSALFRSGHASPAATRERADLAPVCDGLARLGHVCAGVAAAP